jgi:hypothetical protein
VLLLNEFLLLLFISLPTQCRNFWIQLRTVGSEEHVGNSSIWLRDLTPKRHESNTLPEFQFCVGMLAVRVPTEEGFRDHVSGSM